MNAIPDKTQGRVDYLRLSITDRCNLRCTYCMPAEGVPPRSHDDILSYEELAAFARVAAGCGISKVRITGGEPLVRHGCADFVGMLGAHERHPRHLADHQRRAAAAGTRPICARAGLRRVNISLDSLDAERFARLTRGGRLDDALAGLDAAFAAGFSPVKVNALLLDGVEDELDAFVDLTREREVHVRFIEFMPLDRAARRRRPPGAGARRSCSACRSATSWCRTTARTGTARRSTGTCPGRSAPSASSPASPSTSARAATACGSPPTAACAPACSRARRSPSGRSSPVPRELREAIRAAVSGKSYDRCREQLANERAMSQIGG